MNRPHVLVIGAGSTGAAIAHDLALRGVRVTIVDRFGPAGGTTGHNQAQLHSGARYAINDPDSARECIEENRILRHIMPNALELNDGLFIALREDHLAYREKFLEACARCGIPTEEINPAKALQLEPLLNPKLMTAIRIPDGVFDPYRFTLSFLATARKNGAAFLPFTEVIDLNIQHGHVTTRNRSEGAIQTIGCDAVINATGPWAGRLAEMAGIRIELEPSAGVMATLDRRLCNMVINILAPPDDGDIIVPQRNTSILGTTSWTVTDPDQIPIPDGHVARLLELADWMIPGASNTKVRGVMAAARPLIKDADGGRSASRMHRCYDHSQDGVPGFFSIIGGKTTTARHMAEDMSDLVCAKLGVTDPCRTRTELLLPHYLGI